MNNKNEKISTNDSSRFSLNSSVCVAFVNSVRINAITASKCVS